MVIKRVSNFFFCYPLYLSYLNICSAYKSVTHHDVFRLSEIKKKITNYELKNIKKCLVFQVLSSVVDDYYPWGKPGHGAPNDDGLRKRKIFTDPPSPPLKVRTIR